MNKYIKNASRLLASGADKYRWISVWAGIVLAGCTYDIDLNVPPAVPRMVAYCFPVAQDTTWIQLSASTPITAGSGKPAVGLQDAEVTFCVNGVPQPVREYPKKVSENAYTGLYVLGEWKKGDRIELRVADTHLPSVYAETTVPSAFPLDKFEMKIGNHSGRRLQFLIRFTDEGEERNYYGIRIVRKVCSWNDEVYSESVLPIEFDTKEEPLLGNLSGLDEMFSVSENTPYQSMYIWEDTKIQGQTYTLKLSTSYGENFERQPEDNWGSYYKVEYYYQVFLYALSEEFYRYLKNQTDQQNNGLGNNGLGPVPPTYTNIEGGFGVLGGCVMWASGWLENLKPE